MLAITFAERENSEAGMNHEPKVHKTLDMDLTELYNKDRNGHGTVLHFASGSMRMKCNR